MVGRTGALSLDLFGPLSHIFLDHGYLAVYVVLLLCGLGLPLPEEVTLISAGLVVFEQRASFYPMVAVTIAGILSGDLLLLYLGRRFGPQLLRKSLFRRLLHADQMSKVRRQFDRHGVKAVFFARFFAGIRGCVYLTAGTLGMRARTFVMLDLAGALLSAPISVWIGFHFGAHIETVLVFMRRFDRAVLGLLALLAAIYLLRWGARRRRREQR